jgi:hypothetical protein
MGHAAVPWAIEGGEAQIPGRILRQLVTSVTGGVEGVVGALDCRVQSTTVPGAQVRVAPGLYAILSRAAGAQSEMYAGCVETEDLVSIAPTDSSGGRSDLVIARIENPYAAGEVWSPPVDPVVGPYVFTRIIQGVPGSTVKLSDIARTDTAIVLARIDIPISTGTITQAMIKDLRSVVGHGSRASDTLVDQQIWTESTHANGGDQLLAAHTTYRDWPLQASWSVAIPSWATGVDIVSCDVKNPQISGDIYGDMALSIGGTIGTPSVFDIDDTSAGGGVRFPMIIGGTQPIPAAMRGTIQTFKIRARRYSSPVNAGTAQAKEGTYVSVCLNFKRSPSYT